MIQKKMRTVLQNAGISQKEAAEALGITPGELSHWFVGRTQIKAEDVKKFCEAFHTTPNFLFGFEDDITPQDRAILTAIKSATAPKQNAPAVQNPPKQTTIQTGSGRK